MKTQQYYIDDTQWWYDVHGNYNYIQIAITLIKARATGVCRKQKYGWSNMPEVICFRTDNLKAIEAAFIKEFGSDYSFSYKEIW